MEYDIVVLPVVDSFRHQLQRNLLYTAVTRAKHKVFMVGSASALATAVANDREDLRNTMLKDRLGSTTLPPRE
jgi:exodeoxyribonuclease V alpha subunit